MPPNPNVSEIAVMTIENRSKMLADNMSDNCSLLMRLKASGTVKPATGGRLIFQELEYDENQTFQYYSGYEELDTRPSDVFTTAEFPWRQAVVNVSISGLEELQNAGSAAQIDLLSSRIDNAFKTMKNQICNGLYSDGTGADGKQIDGLGAAVSSSPTTGTYGGINRANEMWWRNQAVTGANSATTIRGKMNALWVQLVRNNDSPDLIVADNNLYTYYWEALQDQQRFAGTREARGGFQALQYVTADVVLDGGHGGHAATNSMYFLNTDYIHYRPHRDKNMVRSPNNRFATNQDAMSVPVFWAGNLTTSNSSLQGRLSN